MHWKFPNIFMGGNQDQQPQSNMQDIRTQSWHPSSVVSSSPSSSRPSTPGSYTTASLHNRDRLQSPSRGQASPSEAAGIIARLKDKSVDVLRKLLNDQDAYGTFFQSLDQVKTQNNVPARAAAAAAVARALAGLPPHQRINLPSSSEELISIYGSRPHGQSSVEDLEENFYEEDFDPVKHVLEHIPPEGSDLAYFEERATLRLAQLDRIAERLSHHVMEHHEDMVKGMQLVMELEQDLKVANVICMNGRRHLTSSMHEVSQDLVVNSHAKKKQVLLILVLYLICMIDYANK